MLLAPLCPHVNSKEDPKLWYGIGILYDRYGSLDHAEEAFASVLKMDKGWFPSISTSVSVYIHSAELDFDKANEILFRLGIIYKQQGKYEDSLSCFDRILRNPPSPLAHADIWFQIGHVYEQQKDVSSLGMCGVAACSSLPSMFAPRTHMNVSLPTILVMPRFSSNWGGCITKTDLLSRTKSLPSNT